MKKLDLRVLWGGLLVLGGIVFLLQNLGILELSGYFWALLFGLGGVFFLSFFVQMRANWWALIPGFTLLSIAILLFLSEIAPGLADMIGGSIVLAGIGLSFFVIYIIQRAQWWALIPGGVLLTLAVVAGLDETLSIDTGAVFFLGLGAGLTWGGVIYRFE